MSKKSRNTPAPRKVYPKTNISRAYYKHLVDSIEHDPLVKHTTLTIACMLAAVCVLLGSLIWFAQTNPGNLIQTKATVTNISLGKTDTLGTMSTFVTFEFNTREPVSADAPSSYKVRQQVNDGLRYEQGQVIKVGYHPKNPNYARNLNNTSPPQISIYLWTIPFLIMLWFIFVALLRYNERQNVIWNAAEAADSED